MHRTSIATPSTPTLADDAAPAPAGRPVAAPAGPGQRDLVVVGASAGGVEALKTFVAGLPPELPAAVLVVLHVPATGRSVLADILDRAGPLPAAAATDGAPLRRGEILVAPSDAHLLVHDGHVRLSRGPRENGHRPAIDPLFRSAARAHGGRTIGVVLSGLLDDGAAGLRFVHDEGGATVVQDPEDALHPGMPSAALAAGPVDRTVPAAALADAVCALLDEPLERLRGDVAHGAAGAPDAVERDPVEDDLTRGELSGLTCPDCGGAIWETGDDPARYVCHVGHAFSRDSMLQEQGRALEITLWSALRALEERADLLRRVARRTGGSAGSRLEERAAEADDHARALRRTLLRAGAMPADGVGGRDLRTADGA
ncbi:chemotaxis protein CheB [Patulibacter americanus]|uniref:chemotaxis protein CheB n=1 Tax=Patulibacter americanus TaxID=588672 RepID=UPI0003B4682A|nr:chemotaxis protein CheB [Patulibacter americanus]